ncbi:hypothetical protein [Pseudanabaena cinerea]|nr:hypothetical protein [Pseudanabaena cinerea]
MPLFFSTIFPISFLPTFISQLATIAYQKTNQPAIAYLITRLTI